MIPDAARRADIKARLAENGRTLIELSTHQIAEFAGNAIELQGTQGRVLALSERALKALTVVQVQTLESWVELLPLQVPTIEMAGGSVRCMLAGIHLKPRHPVL